MRLANGGTNWGDLKTEIRKSKANLHKIDLPTLVH